MITNQDEKQATHGQLQTDNIIQCNDMLSGHACIGLALTATEAVSELFEYQLTLLVNTTTLDLTSLLNTTFSVNVANPAQNSQPRTFSGIINRCQQGEKLQHNNWCTYYLTLVPKLWQLTQNRHSRIFTDQTIPDIVTTLLKQAGYGGADYKMNLTNNTQYQKLPYCVQYDESDYDFIHRILSEAGIYYYFKPTDTGHQLICTDAIAGYQTAHLDFTQADNHYHRVMAGITQWHPVASSINDAVQLQADYQPELGPTNTQANYIAGSQQLPGLQQYHNASSQYKTNQTSNSDIQKTAISKDWQQRAKQLNSHKKQQQFIIQGQSTVANIMPAIDISCNVDGNDQQHFVTQVKHIVTAAANNRSLHNTAETPASYHNEFTCLAARASTNPIRFYPIPYQPKQAVGTQRALVIGRDATAKSDKPDVYADKLGRVKVKFFWPDDNNTSTWLRVNQAWAGELMGTHFLPRVGDEVLVDFIDGDINRPYVSGMVSNFQRPPIIDPSGADKTKSAIQSRSFSGAKSHKLEFDDTADNELLTLQSAHDMQIITENNRNDAIQTGNYYATVQQGQYTLNSAKKILLQVGKSQLVINPDNVQITVGGSQITVQTSEIELVSDDIKLNKKKS